MLQEPRSQEPSAKLKHTSLVGHLCCTVEPIQGMLQERPKRRVVWVCRRGKYVKADYWCCSMNIRRSAPTRRATFRVTAYAGSYEDWTSVAQ